MHALCTCSGSDQCVQLAVVSYHVLAMLRTAANIVKGFDMHAQVLLFVESIAHVHAMLAASLSYATMYKRHAPYPCTSSYHALYLLARAHMNTHPAPDIRNRGTDQGCSTWCCMHAVCQSSTAAYKFHIPCGYATAVMQHIRAHEQVAIYTQLGAEPGANPGQCPSSAVQHPCLHCSQCMPHGVAPLLSQSQSVQKWFPVYLDVLCPKTPGNRLADTILQFTTGQSVSSAQH